MGIYRELFQKRGEIGFFFWFLWRNLNMRTRKWQRELNLIGKSQWWEGLVCSFSQQCRWIFLLFPSEIALNLHFWKMDFCEKSDIIKIKGRGVWGLYSTLWTCRQQLVIPVVPEGAQGMAQTPEEFLLYLLLWKSLDSVCNPWEFPQGEAKNFHGLNHVNL